MRFTIDHDLHIHSGLSACSNDLNQTKERILQYALDNGLKTVCVTDHFWDEKVAGSSKWYASQNFDHISKILPLPQAEGVRFLFGCETELDKNLTLGVSWQRMEELDFIIIPTTHFHSKSFVLLPEEAESNQGRAQAWVRRLEGVLNMDLPFHKVGIAHLTCTCIAPTRDEYLEVLNLLPEEEMERLFTKAAELGVGIELNEDDMEFADEEADAVLRAYRIAKQCGCKFYCGSDAHHPGLFLRAKAVFQRAVDLLELEEKDKFIL